jgi:hypothetical protein
MEPPQRAAPGRYFDAAVQSESDERDRSGDQSGDDGHETFEAVVGNGEVFDALAPANEIGSG